LRIAGTEDEVLPPGGNGSCARCLATAASRPPKRAWRAVGAQAVTDRRGTGA